MESCTLLIDVDHSDYPLKKWTLGPISLQKKRSVLMKTEEKEATEQLD